MVGVASSERMARRPVSEASHGIPAPCDKLFCFRGFAKAKHQFKGKKPSGGLCGKRNVELPRSGIHFRVVLEQLFAKCRVLRTLCCEQLADL
jgi:hypothetical protein